MLLAITHLPSPHLQHCELTFVESEPIDMALASIQHHAYGAMLERCGAKVITLDANLSLPDSVFVEDPIIVLDEVAILTSMGVASRREEIPAMEAFFKAYRRIERIELPARIEGGDVLRVGQTLFVGVSARTNIQGIEALKTIVEPLGYRIIPINVTGCLHLKTGVTALDEQTLLINPAWVDANAFEGFRQIAVDPTEPFGANVLKIGTTLCMNEAFPHTQALVRGLGYRVDSVNISEFVKAEAGLTCMSVLMEVRSED